MLCSFTNNVEMLYDWVALLKHLSVLEWLFAENFKYSSDYL